MIGNFTYLLSFGRGPNSAFGVNQGILTAAQSKVITPAILGEVRATFQTGFSEVLGALAKDKRAAAALNLAYAGSEAYLIRELWSQAVDAKHMADHAFQSDPKDPTQPA